ncbi:hypothetical protein [Mycobacterium sp. 050134]|uniref:hypothetical protein n=1 Tax=Mycobacterium sp. 050134 TaxID=3096111 RepID=UPI002ED7E2FF
MTKHADVRSVSRDTETFTSSRGNTLVEVEATSNSAMLPGIDPPRHVHYRKLINQGFTVRTVQRLEPSMREVARGIVATIADKRDFDSVTEISAEMSGCPPRTAWTCSGGAAPSEAWASMIPTTRPRRRRWARPRPRCSPNAAN